MKLKNNQLIDTTPGRLYTVTCAVDVSVYEMDGAVQGLKLLDYKAADGQKEFRATSLQVKIVTGSASEVQGSVTEVFKGAPALMSQGGGGDAVDLDRHTVTLFAQPVQVDQYMVCTLPIPQGYEFDAGAVYITMYGSDNLCVSTYVNNLELIFTAMPATPNGLINNDPYYLIPWVNNVEDWSYVSAIDPGSNTTCSTSSNARGLNSSIYVPEGYKLAKIRFYRTGLQPTDVNFFLTFNVKKITAQATKLVVGEYSMKLETNQPNYDNYV